MANTSLRQMYPHPTTQSDDESYEDGDLDDEGALDEDSKIDTEYLGAEEGIVSDDPDLDMDEVELYESGIGFDNPDQ